NVWINFNADDPLMSEYKRCQDVTSAAYANDKNRRGLSHVMCERRDVVLQMFERFESSIEFRDHRRGARIDIQIELLELLLRLVCRTHSPPKRIFVCLTNVNPRKRIPFLV